MHTSHWGRRESTITGLAIVGSLLLLNGAVIIHKHEGVVVFGVDVTLGALVSRAQIACGVIIGQSGLGGTLLVSSTRDGIRKWGLNNNTIAQRRVNSLPGTLGSVGGNQNVRPAKGIVSPVGDVVQYVLHWGFGEGKIREKKKEDLESTLGKEKKGRIRIENPLKGPLKPPDAG